MNAFDTFLSLNSKIAIVAPATVFIYGLNDPVTGKCRYVGKTASPSRRLDAHLYRSRYKKTHRDCWIVGLKARGLRPVFEIIDEVPEAEWEFWEREYIRVFRAIGMSLTNLTDGGESPTGLTEVSREKMREFNRNRVWTKETREKCRVSQTGRKHSLETRIKMGESQKGLKLGIRLSEEHKRKNSVAHKGQKVSAATREKLSLANRGKRISEEQKAKHSATMTGRKHTKEHNEKIRAALIGRVFSESHRQKISAAKLRRKG